jgi:hypothetical protein
MDSSKVEELAEILRKLAPEDRSRLIDRLSELATESTAHHQAHHLRRMRNALCADDSVALAVWELALTYEMRPEEVLAKGLGLFIIAQDAAAKGFRLAVLNSKDEIEQEIVGIESPRDAVSLPVG